MGSSYVVEKDGSVGDGGWREVQGPWVAVAGQDRAAVSQALLRTKWHQVEKLSASSWAAVTYALTKG